MFNFFKKSDSQSKQQSNSSIIPTSKNELMKKGLILHDDLKDLIWIADGPHKNYSNESTEKNTINLDYFKITISFSNQELSEPLILC